MLRDLIHINMDGIIDIIIAVLFIALPAVFKAIGNRLEKSGKAERAGKFKKVAEAFEDDEDEDTIEGWVLKQMEKSEEKPVEPVVLEPEPVAVPKPAAAQIDIMDYIDKPETVVKRQIKRIPPKPTVRKPMMLVEDEPKKKGEKIDPKKLVIYSEIMKPKF